MKQKSFKLIRVVIALLTFICTTFIFLDFRELLSDGLITGITFLQFIPSLLKFLSTTAFVAMGFLLIIVLTSLFGRVYCSMICPLGIFQDLVGRINGRVSKKHRMRFSRPQTFWRYFFLILPIAILLAGGGLIGIYILDPYSIFGRITSDLGQPGYMWINNRLAGLMERMDLYLLYPEDIVLSKGITYLVPTMMILIVMWFSFKKGRLYCNTICPVGTLLGLLSKISLFKIRIVNDQCTKCGKCVAVCKSSCIDLRKQEVDFSRCVACYNCMAACPEDAIKYLPGKKGKHKELTIAFPEPGSNGSAVRVNSGRRSTLYKLIAAPLVLSGLGSAVSGRIPGEDPDSTKSIRNKIPTKIKPDKTSPVSPPGSLGIEHFTDHCTACHLCISACPTNVLQPSLTQYGLTGFMQPYMDYSTRYCNFDCTRCADICPAGAILSLSKEAKKTTQIGQVKFIEDNCIVKAENTACGSCSEHCPTQAVTMVPYKDNLTIPEIKPEICVGCGACEFACPVQPFKAIYVNGNREHQEAELPDIEELEETKMEDFPF